MDFQSYRQRKIFVFSEPHMLTEKGEKTVKNEQKPFKVRCYRRNGDLDHEEFFDTLDEAVRRRTEWGLSIGLRPEPSADFAYYPTIHEWKRRRYFDGTEDFGWERLMGY